MTGDPASANQPFVFSPAMVGGAAGGMSEPSMVQDTRREISHIVREVAEAAGSEIPTDQFWALLCDRTLRAMAAEGVVVWRVPSSADADSCGEFKVAQRIGRLTDRQIPADGHQPHEQMLAVVAGDAQPVVVPPTPGSNSPDVPANPTDYPAAIVPVAVHPNRPPAYLIEVFLESGGGVATQRGYLRFVAQMADLAGEFLRAAQIRDSERRSIRGRQLEQLVTAIHQSAERERLETLAVDSIADFFGFARVAYVSINELKPRLIAVSHVERIDTRSQAAVAIVDAAYRNLDASGLWTPSIGPSQQTESPDNDLDRVDGLKMAAIAGTANESDDRIVCLVSDTDDTDFTIDEETRRELQYVVRHTVLAIEHHAKLDAIPGGRWLASLAPTIRKHRERSTMRWAVGLSGMILLCVAAMFPMPRVVTAYGTIVAAQQQTVTAHRDAIVDEIHVDHGQTVAVGDELITLRDDELTDRLAAKRTHLANLVSQEGMWNRIAREGGGKRENAELQKNLTSAKIVEVTREINRLEAAEKDLTLRADCAGTVDAWRIEQEYQSRPLRRGEKIMSVVPIGSDWVVDAYVPQNRVGHLDANDQQQFVRITVDPASGETVAGKVQQIGPVIADHSASQTETVTTVRVDLDESVFLGNTDSPIGRAGAPVDVMFHCGTAPLATLLFQDAIDSARGFFGLYVGSRQSVADEQVTVNPGLRKLR